jgi:hypothetical protein
MHRNDCVSAYLPGDSDDYNEKLIAFYQENGATSDDIQDAEREFLVAQGVSTAATPDMWYELLTVLGYSGTLSGMLQEYWCSPDPRVLGRYVVYNGVFVTYNGDFAIHNP